MKNSPQRLFPYIMEITKSRRKLLFEHCSPLAMTYLSEACKPYGLVKKLSAFNNTNDIVLYVSEAFIFDEVAELLAIMPVSAYNEPIEYITDFTDEKNTVEGDYTFIQGKDVTLVGPDGSHTLMKSTLCFPNLDLISNGGKLP